MDSYAFTRVDWTHRISEMNDWLGDDILDQFGQPSTGSCGDDSNNQRFKHTPKPYEIVNKAKKRGLIKFREKFMSCNKLIREGNYKDLISQSIENLRIPLREMSEGIRSFDLNSASRIHQNIRTLEWLADKTDLLDDAKNYSASIFEYMLMKCNEAGEIEEKIRELEKQKDELSSFDESFTRQILNEAQSDEYPEEFLLLNIFIVHYWTNSEFNDADIDTTLPEELWHVCERAKKFANQIHIEK